MARSGLLVAVAVSLVACGSSGDGGTQGAGGAAAQPVAGITKLPEGWTRVQPGADTSCADGSPYEFWVRPGKLNRVVVELEGGGVCWDAKTCGHPDLANDPASYRATFVDDPPDFSVGKAEGIHDHANAKNPFADWHHVFVRYCTGDFHWGDATHDYGDGVVVHHAGARNTSTALAWLYDNLPAPEKVFVTGCSGGSPGSIYWVPDVARHWPSAKVYHLGDAVSGVATKAIIDAARDNFGFESHYPSFLPGADPSKLESLGEVYAAVARGYPAMPIGVFTSSFDTTMLGYYRAMGGGDAWEWGAAQRTIIGDLEAEVPSYDSFVAPGGLQHCVLPRAEVYALQVGEVKLLDWLEQRIDDAAPPSFDCAPDCGAPVWGDLGDPGEWACLGQPPAAPTPAIASFDVALRFVAPDAKLDPAHHGEPFAGLAVAAFANGDDALASPLGATTTDGAGIACLTLPTGEHGFDGFFRATGEDAIPMRYYVGVPLVDSSPWLVAGNTWNVETAASVKKQAERAKATLDPAKGSLIFGTVDCQLSITRKSSATVDDVAPSAFRTWSSPFVTALPTSWPLYFDLAPGTHRVKLLPPGSTDPAKIVDVHVEAGGQTWLHALTPAH
jgi:hypothetical protein